MAEVNASEDPGLGKRRSTRIVQAIPITVSGSDALGQPFKERTSTVMVNCHGCKYQSKHYVPKNSVITLEIPRPEGSEEPRIIKGHVIWVQRPRTVRELFQIGLEFESAGNVWGIAFPPEDWAPAPADDVTEIPLPAAQTPAAAPNSSTTAIPQATTSTPAASEKRLEIVPSPAAPRPTEGFPAAQHHASATTGIPAAPSAAGRHGFGRSRERDGTARRGSTA